MGTKYTDVKNTRLQQNSVFILSDQQFVYVLQNKCEQSGCYGIKENI